MNPYALLGSRIGTSEAVSLSDRLATWHDSMVAHERRLRAVRSDDACDDKCPHMEARTLWAEAATMFGHRASELSFLRSRATTVQAPEANIVDLVSRQSDGAGRSESIEREETHVNRRLRSFADDIVGAIAEQDRGDLSDDITANTRTRGAACSRAGGCNAGERRQHHHPRGERHGWWRWPASR